MHAANNLSSNVDVSIPLALSVSDTCLQLCKVTHEAGLYRMSFLLSEIAREAELALEVHEASRADYTLEV